MKDIKIIEINNTDIENDIEGELETDIDIDEEIDLEDDDDLDIDVDAVVEEETAETIVERIVPFEEDYEDIKGEYNDVWEKYHTKIEKIIKGLSYYKNFDVHELLQQSYIFFVELCDVYDPYYMGNFIPFDKFLFKNLIIKLRAHIQRYYFKSKREQPTEFNDTPALHNSKNNILEVDEKMYSQYLYSLISKRQQQILELSLQGYKQQEIGDMLNISQSRVSIIKKKTLTKLNEILSNNDKPKKRKIRL